MYFCLHIWNWFPTSFRLSGAAAAHDFVFMISNILWNYQSWISGDHFLQQKTSPIERSRNLLFRNTKTITQLQKLLKLQLNKVSKAEIRLMAG